MEFHCAIGESEENLKQLIASVKTLIRKILKVLSTEEHCLATGISIYYKGRGYCHFVGISLNQLNLKKKYHQIHKFVNVLLL